MVFRRMGRSIRGLIPPAEKGGLSNEGNIAAATTNYDVVAVADENVNVNDNSVGIPSRIKAIYLDTTIVFNAAPAAGDKIFWGIRKNPSGSLAQIVPSVTQIYVNKQWDFWFFLGQGKPGTAVGGVPYRIVGWFKIPRRHQIFNRGDQLEVAIRNDSAGTVAQFCSMYLYKWRQ